MQYTTIHFLVRGLSVLTRPDLLLTSRSFELVQSQRGPFYWFSVIAGSSCVPIWGQYFRNLSRTGTSKTTPQQSCTVIFLPNPAAPSLVFGATWLMTYLTWYPPPPFPSPLLPVLSHTFLFRDVPYRIFKHRSNQKPWSVVSLSPIFTPQHSHNRVACPSCS